MRPQTTTTTSYGEPLHEGVAREEAVHRRVLLQPPGEDAEEKFASQLNFAVGEIGK